MKNILLTTVFLICTLNIYAQETVGGRVLKNSKDRTYDRVEQKGGESVDKALDKVEEGITNIFKKKDKKKKDKKKKIKIMIRAIQKL